MKKIFELIGLLSLVCFSFFMTKETVTVVKNMDDIMINIKANYKNYETDSVSASIDKNTIIPGISGHKVNINKSYNAMKEYGKYNDELYIYDNIKPEISIDDNLDKTIISGNKTKRTVSLIFILNSNSDIKDTLNIINNNQVKASFFIDENWLTNNNDIALQLMNNEQVLGNLSNKQDYSDSAFNWINTIIKKVGHQKKGYCLYKDDQSIKKCQMLDNYTISPYIINDNYLMNVKKHLNNGILLAFHQTNQLNKELESIIKFIKSKGYEIENLEKILTE